MKKNSSELPGQNKTVQNKKVFIKHYIESLCIISRACETSGISRTQFYDWIKNDEEFAKAIADAEPQQREFVENALLKRIKEGSDSSIQFYLKTKGKSVGWGTSVDITTGGDKINTISVIRLIEIKKEDEDDTNKE
jgi:hypothetical protein